MSDVVMFIISLPWFFFKWGVIVGGWTLLGGWLYDRIKEEITYSRFK